MSSHEEIEQLRKQLHDAEEHAKAAQQRAEAAEERLETTTFPKFLELGHEFLSDPLQVQTDYSLTTKGSIITPYRQEIPYLPTPIARLS